MHNFLKNLLFTNMCMSVHLHTDVSPWKPGEEGNWILWSCSYRELGLTYLGARMELWSSERAANTEPPIQPSKDS